MKKMRLTSVALSDVAVLVKANLSGWYMLLALLLFSLFMSGCSTGKEELEGCLSTTECTVEARAVSFTCALGTSDNDWLQLNDGAYLQPWHNATSEAYVPPGVAVNILCLQPVTEATT